MGGKGSGTGSPNWFRCWADRRTGRHVRGHHEVSLTGRTRPFKPARGLGSRSVLTAYEYRCSCGHLGWSAHVDLAYMAGDNEALRRTGRRAVA